MGAMWSDESNEEEKPKPKRSRSKKTTKSGFFDDFSFSDINESPPTEHYEEPNDLEELEEEEEPIYVAPLPSIRKRAPRNKSSKSVRFAKRRGTKRNGY